LLARNTRAAPPSYALEDPAVLGAATGEFHLQRIGGRWWFIAPDGNAFFPRAVALMDFGPSGAAGTDFRSYDAVALLPAAASVYRVVTSQAMDPIPSDVVIPGRRYTIRDPGDALLLGSSRFRPEFTKFQLSVRGAGGAIAWYYYSNSAARCGRRPCWLPINGTGNPYASDAAGGSSPFGLNTDSGAYQSRMVNAAGFIAPIAGPSVAIHGAAGIASYTYYAMPRDPHGEQLGNASPATTIANARGRLDDFNYNLITPPRTYPMVAAWDILKGDTAHRLGSVKAGGSLADHGQNTGAYTIVTGADRAQWWNWSVDCPREGSRTWPADFVRLVIAGIDATPRYYLKGVVVKRFTTAPVVSQIVEAETEDELLKARYGGGSAVTARIKWLNHDLPTLEAGGINAAGQYSYSTYLLELGLHNHGIPYTGDGGIRMRQPVPLEYIMTLSGWAMRQTDAFKPPLVASPVKNIYGNVHATYCGGYAGRSPDVFDPDYYRDIVNALRFATGQGLWSGNGNLIPDGARIYAVLSEEADDLFGVNARDHEHLGAAVVMANPYMPRDTHDGVAYRDPVLYAKLALRDLLRARYKTLAALNAAWDTNYTTWDTSAGRIADGTNAYGYGSGFLDEDGRHLIADCRRDDYRYRFTTQPAIQADLDHFIYAWSARYARTLRRAWSMLPDAAHLPPLFVPLYSGVDEAYRAMSPYVDGFWINPGGAAPADSVPLAAADARRDLERILRDTDKPLIVADYSSDFEQQPDFDRNVTAITYDPATGYSTIAVADLPYLFGAPVSLQLVGGKCAGWTARPLAVQWNQVTGRTLLVVAGNLASCVPAHGAIRLRRARDAANVYGNAAERGRASIARLGALLNLAGRDGIRQVAGIEFWGLYPEASVSRGAPHGFGLMTAADNPRDGVSDTAAMAMDRDGYPVGGEQRDRGNLLRGRGSLGGYLAHLYQWLK
jgi:hypothetical protein